MNQRVAKSNIISELFGVLPELVIFDLDGTLVDSVPDIAWSVDQMLTDFGYAAVGEMPVRSWVGNGAGKLVERALSAVEPDAAARTSSFKAMHQCFLDYYAEHTAVQSAVYDGVTDCLQRLLESQVSMACVTNKPLFLAEKLVQALELEDFFSVLLGGDSLLQKKPDPAPLIHVMEKLKATPERSLMVGDSRSDVLAARAAGCPVVCVSYGYNHGEPISQLKPDFVVDSMLELI